MIKKVKLKVERMIREVGEDIIKKYALLLLHAISNEPIKGKTRFMKELFLIGKNIAELEAKTDFESDNYGPNSIYVSNALDDLEVLNLINKINDVYVLSDLGKDIANMVIKDIAKNKIEVIDEMKELCNDLSTDELLALVYYTYPEITDESLVKARIEDKREDLALSLLKKGKISIGKASEIAGLSMSTFYNLLKTKKIKIKMEAS